MTIHAQRREAAGIEGLAGEFEAAAERLAQLPDGDQKDAIQDTMNLMTIGVLASGILGVPVPSSRVNHMMEQWVSDTEARREGAI